MSSPENEEISQKTPLRGRTWADVFVGTSYLAAGLIFLVISGVAVWYIFGRLPNWFFISILGSFLFIPFLFERAKDGAELFLVSEEPYKLTEYRIGRRTGLAIDGKGIQFISNSGVYRTFLQSLDVETMTARGSLFAEFTQIDQMRDLSTLQRMTETLENTLRESRVSSQEVGVEVEKRSIEIVDWALRTIYGAIVPTEISEAFGVKEENPDLKFEEVIETVVADET